jgi:SAM-dependent methyltransferase
MSLDRGTHRTRTLDYFRRAALEKAGFYDAADGAAPGHTIWQRRVRQWLEPRIRQHAASCTTLLDVGCGNGDFLHELAGRLPGLRITGGDFSPEMIEVARARHGGLPNLEFRQRDLLAPAEGEPPFDIVLCLNMFHHLHADDVERGMDALVALTRQVLFFEIKNADNFWNRRFRPREDFPVNLLAPARARDHLRARGLHAVRQWNIFGLAALSPIVILEFVRRPRA